MAELLTYSKFHSLEEAQALIEILENSGIEYRVDHERDVLDKIYTGESLDPMIAVMIPEERFEEINEKLLAQARSQLTDIDPDYYLFSFSNPELIEVLHNPEEWNHFDQALAGKILSERKIDIPEESKTISEAEAWSPIHLDTIWIIAEYLLTIILPYVGILVGLASLLAYKTLKNGRKVKMYDEPTRLHGKIMLALGTLRTLYVFIPWISG